MLPFSGYVWTLTHILNHFIRALSTHATTTNIQCKHNPPLRALALFALAQAAYSWSSAGGACSSTELCRESRSGLGL